MIGVQDSALIIDSVKIHFPGVRRVGSRKHTSHSTVEVEDYDARRTTAWTIDLEQYNFWQSSRNKDSQAGIKPQTIERCTRVRLNTIKSRQTHAAKTRFCSHTQFTLTRVIEDTRARLSWHVRLRPYCLTDNLNS